MDDKDKTPKGVVLLTVIIVIILLSITSVAILTFIQSDTSLTIHNLKRQKAYYLVEAGLKKGWWIIEEDRGKKTTFNLTADYTTTPYEYNWTLQGKDIKITIRGAAGSDYRITSKVEY